MERTVPLKAFETILTCLEDLAAAAEPSPDSEDTALLSRLQDSLVQKAARIPSPSLVPFAARLALTGRAALLELLADTEETEMTFSLASDDLEDLLERVSPAYFARMIDKGYRLDARFGEGCLTHSCTFLYRKAISDARWDRLVAERLLGICYVFPNLDASAFFVRPEDPAHGASILARWLRLQSASFPEEERDTLRSLIHAGCIQDVRSHLLAGTPFSADLLPETPCGMAAERLHRQLSSAHGRMAFMAEGPTLESYILRLQSAAARI